MARWHGVRTVVHASCSEKPFHGVDCGDLGPGRTMGKPMGGETNAWEARRLEPGEPGQATWPPWWLAGGRARCCKDGERDEKSEKEDE